MEIRASANITAASPAAAERDVARHAAKPSAPAAAVKAVGPNASVSAADQLSQAVEHLNKSLQTAGQGVEFSVDKDSERVIVKVVDRETKEVLRQMPTEEALAIAKAIDRTQGLLIKNEA
jgi:flagellar protein FlaG